MVGGWAEQLGETRDGLGPMDPPLDVADHPFVGDTVERAGVGAAGHLDGVMCDRSLTSAGAVVLDRQATVAAAAAAAADTATRAAARRRRLTRFVRAGPSWGV